MVKNTKGGSGHKKFARKFASGGSSKINNLRVSEDVSEIYAIVTKMLGNGMFHCHCIDNKNRLCHIRGKFSYRAGKRDNMVQGGKWILIGLREWDTPEEKSSSISKKNEKMQQCDLLEVYSDMDKQRLKDTITQNWYILDSKDITKIIDGSTPDTEAIEFTHDESKEILFKEIKSSTSNKINLKLEDTKVSGEEVEEEINFDDI
jgi:initiation factor 1A